MRTAQTRIALIWAVALGALGVAFVIVLVAQLFGGGWMALLGVITTQSGTLVNTLLFGTTTAMVATMAAWLVAHTQHSYRFLGQRLLHWLCFAPLLMPSFTVAMALVIVFGANGILVRTLGASPGVYGFGGLVVSGTLARFPYAYLVLLAAYRNIEPDLLDTARSLGASKRRQLSLVLWPKLRLALLSAWLMVFADTVADLANPLVVGGNFHVAASRLYEAVNGEGDLVTASAFAVLLVIPALLYGLVAHHFGLARSAGAFSGTSAGLGRRPDLVGRLGIMVIWGIGLLITVLAVALLVSAFSSPAGGFGLGSFADLLTVPGNRAMASTLLVAVVGVPTAVLLSLGGVLAVAPERQWLDQAAKWCARAAAVPSLVLGLCAYLVLIAVRGVAVDSTSLGTVGVFVLLVAVLLARAVPTSALAMLGRARALLPDARDAAVSLGAGNWKLVKLVYLPKLRGPIRDATVLTTARVLTSTSSVILLSDIRLPMLSVRMLMDTEAGRVSSGAAAAVTSGLVIALVAAVANWGWGRD